MRNVLAGVVAVGVLMAVSYAAGWSDGRRSAERSRLQPTEPILVPDRSVLVPALPAEPWPPSTFDEPDERFAAWSDKDGPDRRLRVFEPSGQVLELRGRLPDAGADDVRTMYLRPDERRRVTTHVRALLSDVRVAAELRASHSRDVRALSVGQVLSAAPGDPHPEASALVAVVDDLFDLANLGIEERWRPWSPSVVTAWIRPTDAPPQAPVPWPLDEPVFRDTEDVDIGPTGEPSPYRCLEGDDAAQVFSLLGTGAGGSIVISDGDRTLQVHLRWAFPYHVIDHHPCGPH